MHREQPSQLVHLLLVFIILFFALIGFIDDHLKLKANNHRGLSAKTKILIQFMKISK